MVREIQKTPHVIYEEADSNPTLSGDGAYVPVFIGKTGNTSADPTKILKFRNYSAARKATTYGGIGTDETTNPLLATLKDFFEEADKQSSEDLSVPYVYVIDMGDTPIKGTYEEGTGDDKVTKNYLDDWAYAFDLAKTKRECTVEILVAFTQETTKGETTTGDNAVDIIRLLVTADTSIEKDAKSGIPRTLLTTISGATDENLISYTQEESGEGKYINDSRIAIVEPTGAGKIFARICCTPFNIEPGYYTFRTIQSGVYNKRTDDEQEELMNAGIIFVRDELANNTIYPKICLAVSTAMGLTPATRPNDALLHQRRNADNLITKIYNICYSQLKRNETKVNLATLQTDIDTIVEDQITEGNMMKGTTVKVSESDVDPYQIQVEGACIPVNSTLYIHFSMFVEEPNTKAIDDN